MKIQYLGTAAAEGWPGIFCRCAVCREALRRGGKDIRTRSQAVIDDRILIDLPQDTYSHMLRFGLDLPSIGTLLVTHSHQDHWYPEELMMRREGFAVDMRGVLEIYGNDAVGAQLDRVVKDALEYSPNKARINYHEIREFETYHAEGYEFIPLKASHNPRENCFLYVIRKDGRTLFYGNDTGYLPEETWDFIREYRFDLVSMDCTMQKEKLETNHMGLPNNVDVANRLKDMGCADAHTKFVVTHFSHNGGWLHEEMEKRAGEYGFLTAYDGMTVEF